MSGTAAPVRVTGLIAESNTLPTGGTVRLRWAAYTGPGDELQLQGSNDGAKTWQPFHRVAASTTSTTKGGLVDSAWLLRVVARRGGQPIAGSESAPVAVRVGPAPVQPAPAPTPVPTPAPTPAPAPTAADLAALAARVAALEKTLAAPIRGTGTMALSIEGQAGTGTAKVEMLLTPQTAT